MPRSKIKLVTDSCCHVAAANVPGRIGKGYSACGVLILDMADQTIREVSKFFGEMTVPEAEYSAIIFALDEAAADGRGEVEVWSDSEFVVRQLNGVYAIRSEKMKGLYDEVRRLERRFLKDVHYFHHPRTSPLAQRADALAEQEYRRHRL